MSDPDSRMSYYGDKTQAHARTHTNSRDPGQVSPGVGGGQGALIGELAAVIGGPCELPADFDRVG